MGDEWGEFWPLTEGRAEHDNSVMKECIREAEVDWVSVYFENV